jgi:tRNA (Thr-GGU) A37 N-methylase
MGEGDLKKIEMRPIGFVRRISSDEDVRDRSLVSKIVLVRGLAQALDGIEEWSHIYVIYWLNKVLRTEERFAFSWYQGGVTAVGNPRYKGSDSSQSHRADFGGACEA